MKTLDQSVEEFRLVSDQLIVARRFALAANDAVRRAMAEREAAEKEQRELYSKWKGLAMAAMSSFHLTDDEMKELF